MTLISISIYRDVSLVLIKYGEWQCGFFEEYCRLFIFLVDVSLSF